VLQGLSFTMIVRRYCRDSLDIEEYTEIKTGLIREAPREAWWAGKPDADAGAGVISCRSLS